jgi:hypothetical protein
MLSVHSKRVKRLQKSAPHLFLSNRDIGAHFHIEAFGRGDSGGLATFDGIDADGETYRFRERGLSGKDESWSARFCVLNTKRVTCWDPDEDNDDIYCPCEEYGYDNSDGCRFCDDAPQELHGLSADELENRLQELPSTLFLTNADIGTLFNFWEFYDGYDGRYQFEARFDGIDDEGHFVFWSPGSQEESDIGRMHPQKPGVYKLTLEELMLEDMCEMDERYTNWTDDEGYNDYTNRILPTFAGEPFHTRVGQARQLWKELFQLLSLCSLQQRFKERFYAPGGVFEKEASARFETSAKRQKTLA